MRCMVSVSVNSLRCASGGTQVSVEHAGQWRQACRCWHDGAREGVDLVSQVLQDAQLYEGLLMEALLVADDLQRTQLPCLVIAALQYLLPKALQHPDDFQVHWTYYLPACASLRHCQVQAAQQILHPQG